MLVSQYFNRLFFILSLAYSFFFFLENPTIAGRPLHTHTASCLLPARHPHGDELCPLLSSLCRPDPGWPRSCIRLTRISELSTGKIELLHFIRSVRWMPILSCFLSSSCLSLFAPLWILYEHRALLTALPSHCLLMLHVSGKVHWSCVCSCTWYRSEYSR